MMSSINNDPNQAWSIITDALNNNFPVGVDTASGAPYGLVPGHAHTITSAHTLKDAYGNVKFRLLRIRNPWGRDMYTGPWNDGDTSRWTTAYKAQVPYANNANDGYFYMEVSDLVTSFNYFQVNYYRADWSLNYYEKVNDDDSVKTYTFTVPRQ